MSCSTRGSGGRPGFSARGAGIGADRDGDGGVGEFIARRQPLLLVSDDLRGHFSFVGARRMDPNSAANHTRDSEIETDRLLTTRR